MDPRVRVGEGLRASRPFPVMRGGAGGNREAGLPNTARHHEGRQRFNVRGAKDILRGRWGGPLGDGIGAKTPVIIHPGIGETKGPVLLGSSITRPYR